MALFKRLFFRKPPDRLLEIAERVYVFDSCFSKEVVKEDEYKDYTAGIISQLQDYHPDASFMVCNFRERDKRSQISDILSGFDIVVMDYPLQSEVCPLLPLVMIHHYLKSCESWLSMEGIHNVLLMHCDRRGWPVLSFMLASLLLHMKHYTAEQKTLEMVYKQAPKELLHLLCPLNPQPSHLRYLQYISRHGGLSDWPLPDAPFTLECLILRAIPRFDGEGGCRPMVHIFQQDHLTTTSSSQKTVFTTPRTKNHIHHYRQEEAVMMKINARCCVQGDVVIECLNLDKDLEHAKMMFRVMFNTAFVQSKTLSLTRDEIDVAWSAKDQFPRDFKIEVVFSDSDAFDSDTSTEPVAEEGDETECTFTEASDEFFEAEEVFSSPDWNEKKKDPDTLAHEAKRDPERRSNEATDGSIKMRISAKDSVTMIPQSSTHGEKVGNLEASSMLEEAENIYKTRKSKHDKEILLETLIGLDMVVPIEDKAIIENSILPQKHNCCNSSSVAKEKKVLDISNKEDIIGDIKASTIMESLRHKLEIPYMEGMLKQEIRHSTCHKDKIISISRSNVIDDSPSSEIFCHSAEPIQDSSSETMNQKIIRLPNANTESEKNDDISVFINNTVTCKDKDVLEVSTFQHELKDIFPLDVKDGNTTEACSIRNEAKQYKTSKMIILPDTNCNSEAPALTGKAESSLDRNVYGLNPEIVVSKKISTHSDKGCNTGGQDIVSADKFEMEMHASRVDTEKGNSITETKLSSNATGDKTLDDAEMPNHEQSPKTISTKTSTCTRRPACDITSKSKIKQQEYVGYPVNATDAKTVCQWISPKKISENTSVHIPSTHNYTTATVTASAMSGHYNIGHVAEGTLLFASISGAPNCILSIVQPHNVASSVASPLENPSPSLSQLQALPPPPPPPPPPLYLGASSSSFSTNTYYRQPSLAPPKPAKVTSPASPSYVVIKTPISLLPLPNASPSPPPPPPPPHPLSSSVRSSGYLPPPHPPVILSDSSPPSPILLGESVKGPPLINSNIISRTFVKSAPTPPPPSPPPPPPPPPPYSCTKSTMKDQLMPQSPSTPPLIGNTSVVPPVSSLQSNQRGKVPGPPPPPPLPLRQNTIVTSVSHTLCPAIARKCSGPPPAPHPAPLLKSSKNSSKLPGGPTPIPPSPLPSTLGGARTPQPSLGAHVGAPPPPPPPNRRGSPRARRSPSPTLSSRHISHVDARGLSPRHRIVLPTASSSLAPRKLSLKPLHWVKVTRAIQGSLWAELQESDDAPSASEFDVLELERLFSAMGPRKDDSSKTERHRKSLGSKPDKVHLIDLRRANNTEIMLSKVKMPLSHLMSAVLAMDHSILDVDQVENLIKFCPTKEEMELLRGYSGDNEKLGKCEQYFLELMKIPRVESKLRVFSFKIQFFSQVSDIRTSLNTIDSICDQVRSSVKLKEIMKKILYLGNTLNQGTARGSAIGFRLDSLVKLTDTRATNNRMTLMHYLCKVLAMHSPHLLDFYEDITCLEAASKIQLKYLAEEMQAIVKGLEKVELEMQASENDGPVSEVFQKTLKDFTGIAGTEVQSLTSFYTAAGKKADALALYFGEDPARCPFELVVSNLLNFVSCFRRAHQENCKQAELEKKKTEREREMGKSKLSTPRTRKKKRSAPSGFPVISDSNQKNTSGGKILFRCLAAIRGFDCDLTRYLNLMPNACLDYGVGFVLIAPQS
ncbi:hypothetical protein Cni_G10415 [Canna indica]|uniref:Formin-like protein n=1 Tax=Canna indica TaxID=4628 RepID=A0AAQ3K473_9LILI|nr:hypothetical protein Cni_G10415 [Canna indica]